MTHSDNLGAAGLGASQANVNQLSADIDALYGDLDVDSGSTLNNINTSDSKSEKLGKHDRQENSARSLASFKRPKITRTTSTMSDPGANVLRSGSATPKTVTLRKLI